MTKRFTPEYHSTILQILDNNRGNIIRTSLQTGVSERTLYSWQRKRALSQQQPQNLQQSLSLPPPQNSEDEFALLRQRLMRNILAIADSLELNIESGSLTARVKAIRTLLDSLMDLESQFETESSTPIFRIEYVDEHGRVHNSPPKEAFNDDESHYME